MDLPEGLTARALRHDDARAVFEVIAAQEKQDIGSVQIEEADIVGDWQRPSFDIESSTLGIFDAEQLVGYGEVSSAYQSDAAVHPDYRGRGLGTLIARWTQDLARSRGHSIVGMSVPSGSAGDRLLESLGYFVRWESWVLELPPGRSIDPQPLPEGYALRTVEGEDDLRAAWTVIEDAFLEWSERDRFSFEDFSATHQGRPGFEPWNLRLAVDPGGEVVGACYTILAGDTGYVDQVAVRRDQRGLGLARVMLADAFGNARDHGATRSELATDSRTGALGLYERVGMVVTSTYVHRAIHL